MPYIPPPYSIYRAIVKKTLHHAETKIEQPDIDTYDFKEIRREVDPLLDEHKRAWVEWTYVRSSTPYVRSQGGAQYWKIDHYWQLDVMKPW